jgi:hypothetical protein
MYDPNVQQNYNYNLWVIIYLCTDWWFTMK